MIVYSLKCAKNHEFEAWFRDSAAYDAQVARRGVSCPDCGNTRIEKMPMAPRLTKTGKAAGEVPAGPIDTNAEPAKTPVVMARAALEAIRKEIEAKCDYVGERFAEEARKIHYGEAARRDIYGEANDDDAAALADEGIEFHRIPWARRTNG